MIIHLNGWPGVGKLTIAHLLTQDIGGRLLDSHTIYNVAFSVTDFGAPTFYDTVRSVRDIAFERVAELPATVPVVMTNAYADTPFGNENRRPPPLRAFRCSSGLLSRRECSANSIAGACSIAEAPRRIQALAVPPKAHTTRRWRRSPVADRHYGADPKNMCPPDCPVDQVPIECLRSGLDRPCLAPDRGAESGHRRNSARANRRRSDACDQQSTR
jgi:hypothetical protein